MPDKLTDKEIVKALECCCIEHACGKCPYTRNKGCSCINGILKDALDLINRQKAEIERLLQKLQRPQDADPMDFCGVLCDFSEELIKKAKAEARKEFAERLKADMDGWIYDFEYHSELYSALNRVDNLLKKMEGEENA